MSENPLHRQDLIGRLVACSEQQFSGWLTITQEQGTPGSQLRWGLHFFLGRLIGEMGGQHPTRRWRRQLIRRCRDLQLKDAEDLAYGHRRGYHYQALVQEVAAGRIRREEAAAVIEGSLAETVVDLLQRESWQTHPRGLIYSYSPEDTLSPLDAAMIPVGVRYVLQQAQREWLEWSKAGLSEWSPNLAPVIADRERLRQRTSATSFRNLCTLLDGHETSRRWRECTLRDLAVKVGQDPVLVAQSLLPYVNADILRWVEIPDLERPRTDLIPTPPPHSPQKTSARAALGPALSPLVAYVDDSAMDGRVMEQVLDHLGCRAMVIPDPLQALPLVLETRPHLIFLDLVMPAMSGYELCGQFRRSSALKEIPIIIVTSSDGLVDRVRAKIVGATGFMAKPIDRAQVLTTLVTQNVLPPPTDLEPPRSAPRIQDRQDPLSA